MKISKLFHWLYAVLMFLPIIVFIPNAFYYGFNETAQAQVRTEQEPVYYQTNEITSYTDFVIGNVYHWSNHLSRLTGSGSNELYLQINILNGRNIDLTGNMYLTTDGYLYFSYNSSNIMLDEFDFLLINTLGSLPLIRSEVIERIVPCNINYLKEYLPVDYTMSITDSMAHAFDSTMTNDLFNWSYSSFLTEPFTYIGNIFGLPVDNSIYYLLSYWLDISIIWLVFDLVMYFPMLVHRWIDKGVLE